MLILSRLVHFSLNDHVIYGEIVPSLGTNWLLILYTERYGLYSGTLISGFFTGFTAEPSGAFTGTGFSNL